MPEEEPGSIERYVLPLLRERLLWPIILVVIGHIVAFVAPMLLLGLRDRRFSALAALFLVAAGTVALVRFEIRQRERPRELSALAAVTWVVAIGCALLADHYGVF